MHKYYHRLNEQGHNVADIVADTGLLKNKRITCQYTSRQSL